MAGELRRFLVSFTVAVAATAAAVGVRWLLTPLLGHSLPFITLYGAVAVAVWFGGWRPALFSAILGYVAAVLLFVETEPGTPLSLQGPAGVAGMAVYLASSFIVIGLGSGMRNAQRRAEAAAREALEHQQRLETEAAERRKTEEALRDSEALKAAVLEASLDAIITMDHEGKVVEFNPAAERMFGYRQSELVGRLMADFIIPVALRQAHSRGLAHYLATGEGPVLDRRIEMTALRSDGKEFPVELAITRLTKAGPPVFTAYVRDITQRRRDEQALRSALEELTDAHRRKDEFLAMLAHELRNPLAPVRNAIEVLRLKGPSSPELLWARDVMDRQMQQMTRLIDDLMDVSRISRNKLELRKEQVDLARILHSAVETSRPLIDAAGQELTLSLPPEPMYLEGDMTRLAQVFSNLLNNAAKYSRPGGRISVAAQAQGSDVVVSVQDNGIGIRKEMLPRIFDMFAQAEGFPERSQQGMGIGLTLVKRLVEMHGGSVEAFSEGPDRGSRFVVRLPLAKAYVPRPAQSPADADHPTLARKQCRILVADDNRDSATSLGVLLGMLGYETRAAFDGLEALEAAAEFRPDVALLDIGMPKLSGHEVARRLHEKPWGRDIVLIAVTGWGQGEDRQRSIEAGFDHHLVKPVDPVALEKLLASLVADVRGARNPGMNDTLT